MILTPGEKKERSAGDMASRGRSRPGEGGPRRPGNPRQASGGRSLIRSTTAMV